MVKNNSLLKIADYIHIAEAASKYPSKSMVKPFLESKDFLIGNAAKYLTRYMSEGDEKSGNTTDLLKAIHYLKLELDRVSCK